MSLQDPAGGEGRQVDRPAGQGPLPWPKKPLLVGSWRGPVSRARFSPPLGGHADSAPPHVAQAGRRDVCPLVACGLCPSFPPSSPGLTCSCQPRQPQHLLSGSQGVSMGRWPCLWPALGRCTAGLWAQGGAAVRGVGAGALRLGGPHGLGQHVHVELTDLLRSGCRS